MSLDALKSAAAALDEPSQRELLRYLVSLRELEWAARAEAAGKRLDTQGAIEWLSLEEFKERLDATPTGD